MRGGGSLPLGKTSEGVQMPFPLESFQGIFPAALTVFDERERLDEEGTARHWEWLLREGVDGLVIAGTSGEFIALEKEERIRLFRLARQVAAGRVPVVCGTGHYSTRITIELCQAAEEAGADALLVILPYYQRPPKPAVLEHYRCIRRETSRPLFLYNNPGHSACPELTPPEIARLVDEGVLHGVKSTFGTVEPIHDLRHLAGDRLAIFYGSFLAPFAGLLAGAQGWISGILNLVPRLARCLDRACRIEKDLGKGQEAWKKMLPLIHLYTYQQVGPAADLPLYRSILKLWGRSAGFSRRPFLPLSSSQEEKLEQLLRQSGWRDPERMLEGVD